MMRDGSKISFYLQQYWSVSFWLLHFVDVLNKNIYIVYASITEVQGIIIGNFKIWGIVNRTSKCFWLSGVFPSCDYTLTVFKPLPAGTG